MKAIWAALVMIAAIPAVAAEPAAGELGWMSGRWEMSDGDRWSEEYWSAPRGGVMIGYSRSGRGDTLGEFEYLRIAPAEDGTLAYHASPGGRPPVRFRLVETSGSSAVFAAPSHDYPQRIVYRRDGGEMVATISSADGSNPQSWTYRRAD